MKHKQHIKYQSKIQVIFFSVNNHEAANSLSPSQAFQQNLPQRRQDISQIPPDPVLTFMGNRNTHGLGGAMGNRKTHGFPSSSSNNKEGASLSQIFSPSILHLIPDTKTMQEKLFDVDQVSCPLEFYFSFLKGGIALIKCAVRTHAAKRVLWL